MAPEGRWRSTVKLNPKWRPIARRSLDRASTMSQIVANELDADVPCGLKTERRRMRRQRQDDLEALAVRTPRAVG
jgi:hypothetical protein